MEYSTEIIGNTLTLTGEIQSLTTIKTPVRSVTIRNKAGNAPLYLYSAGGVICFYLDENECISIAIRSPSKIHVQGTQGQTIYWLANALQLR